MTTAGKWFVGILAVLVISAGVFCGLYFGVPAVHDWFVNLFTPDKSETVESGAEAVKILLKI